METKPIGLYVHVPFCVRKCDYCDFASEALSVSKREKYIDSLLSEIESYKDENISVDTVFFGGGTPTSLDASELLKIIEKIKKCYKAFVDAGFLSAQTMSLNAFYKHLLLDYHFKSKIQII